MVFSSRIWTIILRKGRAIEEIVSYQDNIPSFFPELNRRKKRIGFDEVQLSEEEFEQAEKLYRTLKFKGRCGFGQKPAIIVVDMEKYATLPDGPIFGGPGVVSTLKPIRMLLDKARAKKIQVIYTVVGYDKDPAIWSARRKNSRLDRLQNRYKMDRNRRFDLSTGRGYGSFQEIPVRILRNRPPDEIDLSRY